MYRAVRKYTASLSLVLFKESAFEIGLVLHGVFLRALEHEYVGRMDVTLTALYGHDH